MGIGLAQILSYISAFDAIFLSMHDWLSVKQTRGA